MDLKQVTARLEQRGWRFQGTTLYAPNGTMWVEEEVPWHWGWEVYRQRMHDRRDRIVAAWGGDPSHAESIADVQSLVDVLDELWIEEG